MTVFANERAFNDPASRHRAAGVDLDARRAIVDPRGEVLAYAQTGGILDPKRYELAPGLKIYRMSEARRGVEKAAAGAWWVEQPEFDKLMSFAQKHNLGVGLAARLLMLVPPEWSDLSLLVRARVRQDILAWRGLANTVVVAATTGRPAVRLPHQNEIAARRLNQLYIPGLGEPDISGAAIQIENDYRLNPNESLRGFLYL